MLANEKSQKVADYKYECDVCSYFSNNKYDYQKHLSTDKHFRLINTNISTQISQKSQQHSCVCGKSYRHSSSLSKHKKVCLDNVNEKPEITPELLIELIKQNKEMQQALINQGKVIADMAEKAGNNNGNNSHNTHSNNKTFNLQFFLNETCKDAINMSDFVNQIKVSLEDLEETGRIGYAEGISKVFIKNLNDIDYNERPVHCNDYKRETIYIKENDKWLKDDEKKTGLTKAIKQVAHKNIQQISEWQKEHPDFSDPESKTNDKYMEIVLNSMSGSTIEEQQTNIAKIIKNITKEVVIEK
jgi:hypothetical protein